VGWSASTSCTGSCDSQGSGRPRPDQTHPPSTPLQRGLTVARSG
jgi:hypothetical protein